jgi:hypothetical protein
MAPRASTGRAPSPQRDLSADRLFAELDRRQIIGYPDGTTTIEVTSIHVTETAGTWVQMQIAGEGKESVLLHLPNSTTVDEAIAALNEWGHMARECRPQCIDVTPHVVRKEWASDPRRI